MRLISYSIQNIEIVPNVNSGFCIMKRSFNHKKATQILNYFAQVEGGQINKMKSLKLLWLADRLHLRLYGRSISNDNYVAMKNGPVASCAKDIVENNGYCPEEQKAYARSFINLREDWHTLDSVSDADLKVFSKSDVSILEKVYDSFGDKDQYELSELSHLYPEWKRWERALEDNPSTRFPMSDEDFFADPESGSDLLFNEPKERLETNKAVFLEAC